MELIQCSCQVVCFRKLRLHVSINTCVSNDVNDPGCWPEYDGSLWNSKVRRHLVQWCPLWQWSAFKAWVSFCRNDNHPEGLSQENLRAWEDSFTMPNPNPEHKKRPTLYFIRRSSTLHTPGPGQVGRELLSLTWRPTAPGAVALI